MRYATLALVALLGMGSMLVVLASPGAGIPNSPLTKGIRSQNIGLLELSVGVQNSSRFYLPDAGASVVIGQQLSRIRLALQTNLNGVLRFPLESGHYGVVVGDSRFSITIPVDIAADWTTDVNVLVNRTSYPAVFADLTDLDSSGGVNPWETVQAAVSGMTLSPFGSGPFSLICPYFLPGPQIRGNISGCISVSNPPVGSNGTVPHFSAPIFIQTTGPEIGTDIMSQNSRGGLDWLSLRPHATFSDVQMSWLFVVQYTPKYQTHDVPGIPGVLQG